MGFGNLGIWEILVIAVIILLFFGPRRLPEIARSMGGAFREFKRGLNELQRELEIAEEQEGSKRESPRGERKKGIEPRQDPPGAVAAGTSGSYEPASAKGPVASDPTAAEGSVAADSPPPDPAQSDLFGSGRS